MSPLSVIVSTEVSEPASKPAVVHSPCCTECGLEIPMVRMLANPLARQCVPCLERMGDVPKIKRYDETGRGGVSQTYFTENRRLERYISKTNKLVPPDDAFDIAVGDDSHLIREKSAPTAIAYSLGESFESDTEPEQKPEIKSLSARSIPQIHSTKLTHSHTVM